MVVLEGGGWPPSTEGLCDAGPGGKKATAEFRELRCASRTLKARHALFTSRRPARHRPDETCTTPASSPHGAKG